MQVTTLLLEELPPIPVVQQLLELELPVLQDFMLEAFEDEPWLLFGLLRFLPAPDTNCISSKDKIRIMNS